MTEYEVVNMDQTFFVPKYVIDDLLPSFKTSLEAYIQKQSNTPEHKRHSAYKILSKVGVDKADIWLATLLIAPLISDNSKDNPVALGLSGFTKFYTKKWGFYDKDKPRDSYEATLRVVREFINSTGLVTTETNRVLGSKEQQTDFVLTDFGKGLYPSFNIEMADEQYSETHEPTLEPIEYMSAPWLASTGNRHNKLQDEKTESRLASQATAASSVGFLIPSKVSQVYLDWFEVKEVPPSLLTKMARFLRTKERNKAMGIRRMELSRREALKKYEDQLTYYPVGYDRKARQYMKGYPINPQGAKADRSLFYVMSPKAPKEKILTDMNMVGEDLFGKEWEIVSKMPLNMIEDHNSDVIKTVCTTKGELDLDKYTILLEYIKESNSANEII